MNYRFQNLNFIFKEITYMYSITSIFIAAFSAFLNTPANPFKPLCSFLLALSTLIFR